MRHPDIDEVGKEPKATRAHPYETLSRNQLAFFKVTETESQRIQGNSIVDELTDKGWIVPADPKLKRQSHSGRTFYMIKPKALVDDERKRNRQRAKAQEGFATSGKMGDVIVSQSKDETYYPGQEIFDAASRSTNNG